MKRDSILYTVIFTFISTFILVFILSLTANFTRERVELEKKQSIIKAYLGAIGVVSDNPQDEFIKIFGIDSPTDEPLSIVLDGKKVVVTRVSGEGLWGTITGVLAIQENFSRIIGFDIISHSETPGLGGRIEERWFLDQFNGEKLLDNKITVVQSGTEGDMDHNNGLIDGITGATRTSESIQKIVNSEVAKLSGTLPFIDTLNNKELKTYNYIATLGIKPQTKDELNTEFKSIFKDGSIEDEYLYGRYNNLNILATTFSEMGHWDTINGVIIIDLSSRSILEVMITSHAEQVGAPISEEWFAKQFSGLSLDKKIKVSPPEVDGHSTYIKVDGISGATDTNMGVTKGINDAISKLKKEGILNE